MFVEEILQKTHEHGPSKPQTSTKLRRNSINSVKLQKLSINTNNTNNITTSTPKSPSGAGSKLKTMGSSIHSKSTNALSLLLISPTTANQLPLQVGPESLRNLKLQTTQILGDRNPHSYHNVYQQLLRDKIMNPNRIKPKVDMTYAHIKFKYRDILELERLYYEYINNKKIAQLVLEQEEKFIYIPKVDRHPLVASYMKLLKYFNQYMQYYTKMNIILPKQYPRDVDELLLLNEHSLTKQQSLITKQREIMIQESDFMALENNLKECDMTFTQQDVDNTVLPYSYQDFLKVDYENAHCVASKAASTNTSGQNEQSLQNKFTPVIQSLLNAAVLQSNSFHPTNTSASTQTQTQNSDECYIYIDRLLPSPKMDSLQSKQQVHTDTDTDNDNNNKIAASTTAAYSSSKDLNVVSIDDKSEDNNMALWRVNVVRYTDNQKRSFLFHEIDILTALQTIYSSATTAASSLQKGASFFVTQASDLVHTNSNNNSQNNTARKESIQEPSNQPINNNNNNNNSTSRIVYSCLRKCNPAPNKIISTVTTSITLAADDDEVASLPAMHVSIKIHPEFHHSASSSSSSPPSSSQLNHHTHTYNNPYTIKIQFIFQIPANNNSTNDDQISESTTPCYVFTTDSYELSQFWKYQNIVHA